MSDIALYVSLSVPLAIVWALLLPARWRARISLTMLAAAAGLWVVSLALWIGV